MTPQLSFKGMDTSPALAADIMEKIEGVGRVAPTLTSCRVLIEAPHRSKQRGYLYHVLIQATLSGREIVVGKSHDADPAHQDPYIAVRDAFLALRRRIDDVRE